MNGMRLNRSGLNMSRLNASLLNASGIGAMGCKGKATMEDRIMESMVLWYDIGKQGATNEGMAADPRIIDHSGNGHHATCHNFAWSGMSGIGGYVFNYNVWENDGVVNEGVQVVKNDHQMIFNSFGTRFNGNIAYEYAGNTDKLASYTLRVTNIPANGLKYYVSIQEEGQDIQNLLSLALHEGDNIIPEVEIPATYAGTILVRIFLNRISEDISAPLTIEQLPLYPNALVSDGVDDYAQTQPFHIPKEFTVMWDVDWLGERTSANAGFVKPNSFYVYRGNSADNIIAFINNVASYDSIPKDTFCISGLTAYDKEYNAVALTDAQDVNESTDYLGIFQGSVNSNVVSMAFRKFLLFDRVLTLEEIDWVKRT